MTYEIKITFDQALLPDDFSIVIDESPVAFELEQQQVRITCAHSGFLHQLKLTNISGKRFRIEQVQVGACDLRKLIYLSWIQNQNGQLFQPATELWEAQQVWTLPFAYPLSGWLEQVEKKITNDLFGQNLQGLFDCYYPQSVQLDAQKFPQMIRDFYEHNFSFTVLDPKQPDLLRLPYMTYDHPVDPDLVAQARHEVEHNLDYVMANGLSYGQYQANLTEYSFESNSACWRIIWLQKDKKTTSAAELFPAVNRLVESQGLDHWYVFVGVLPPGGFIYPHLDFDTAKASSQAYSEYQGCTQLYIPLSWPAGNLIKFAGAGVLSLDSGQAMVINNDNYVHSVVNDSDQNRIVLSIRSHQNIIDRCNIGVCEFESYK